jgi:hypothetical protein
MDEYLYLTDWSLLEEVSRWRRNKGELAALAKEWETVLHREVKWKMAYDRTLSLNELRYGVALIQDADWEKRIRSALPQAARDLIFRVDMATQDPRPENPFAMGKNKFTSSTLPPVKLPKSPWPSFSSLSRPKWSNSEFLR